MACLTSQRVDQRQKPRVDEHAAADNVAPTGVNDRPALHILCGKRQNHVSSLLRVLDAHLHAVDQLARIHLFALSGEAERRNSSRHADERPGFLKINSAQGIMQNAINIVLRLRNLLGSGRVGEQIPFAHPHRTYIHADRLSNFAGLLPCSAQHHFSRTTAEVHHQQRSFVAQLLSTQMGGRSQEAQARFLSARDHFRASAEKAFHLVFKLFTVRGITSSRSGNEADAIDTTSQSDNLGKSSNRRISTLESLRCKSVIAVDVLA